MKIAAYQFDVTGNIHQNMNIINRAVEQAAEQNVKMIIFPECAITGYPPRNIPDAKSFDTAEFTKAVRLLQDRSDSLDINILTGSISSDHGRYYNRAYFFAPGKPVLWYGKRALYGWDDQNFTAGNENGVFTAEGYFFGVRICFEIRFPEYFRELYMADTDFNIVLFCDVSDTDDTDRYHLIRSHLLTRASENVTPVFSVNATKPFQTAPTCVINASGKIVAEQERNKEGMLVYDFSRTNPDFGEKGRKQFSDRLLGLYSEKQNPPIIKNRKNRKKQICLKKKNTCTGAVCPFTDLRRSNP